MQIENKTNQPEKDKRNVDRLWENNKKFIKNNRVILNYSKMLEPTNIMCLLKKLTILHWVLMLIK